jgi:hypothetical protein
MDPAQEGRTPNLVQSSVFQQHMKAVFEYLPVLGPKGASDPPQWGVQHEKPRIFNTRS